MTRGRVKVDGSVLMPARALVANRDGLAVLNRAARRRPSHGGTHPAVTKRVGRKIDGNRHCVRVKGIASSGKDGASNDL